MSNPIVLPEPAFNYDKPQYWISNPADMAPKRSDYIKFPFYDWALDAEQLITDLVNNGLAFPATHRIIYLGAGLSELPFLLPNTILGTDISTETINTMNALATQRKESNVKYITNDVLALKAGDITFKADLLLDKGLFTVMSIEGQEEEYVESLKELSKDTNASEILIVGVGNLKDELDNYGFTLVSQKEITNNENGDLFIALFNIPSI